MSYLLGGSATHATWYILDRILCRYQQKKKKQQRTSHHHNQSQPQPFSAEKGYCALHKEKEVPSPPRWPRTFEIIEDEPRFKGLGETLTLNVSPS